MDYLLYEKFKNAITLNALIISCEICEIHIFTGFNHEFIEEKPDLFFD
jgi:hypothetical protein